VIWDANGTRHVTGYQLEKQAYNTQGDTRALDNVTSYMLRSKGSIGSFGWTIPYKEKWDVLSAPAVS
jgi:hypothetical protein